MKAKTDAQQRWLDQAITQKPLSDYGESWWASGLTREEFQRRARQEQNRMARSRIAQQIGTGAREFSESHKA